MPAIIERPKVRLLVTDLDNTLWDWFQAWHASFSAMLAKLVELSGVPQDRLESEIRAVHQARATSEYSFLLNELPSLQGGDGGPDALTKYDEAIHVLNAERKRCTRLYPGVLETLTAIRARGVHVVAYTESLAYSTEWRIKHTGLDGVIDVLYSAPDHDRPVGVDISEIRRRPPEEYGLKVTRHEQVERGILKPNENILRTILKRAACDPHAAVYVGDSLMKDVAMAQAVGVHDVYAAYGVSQSRPEYELLQRVSHWPEVDVEREKALMRRADVVPTRVLTTRFAELLDMFEFKGSAV